MTTQLRGGSKEFQKLQEAEGMGDGELGPEMPKDLARTTLSASFVFVCDGIQFHSFMRLIEFALRRRRRRCMSFRSWSGMGLMSWIGQRVLLSPVPGPRGRV